MKKVKEKLIISVASLTLRFYKCDGWTKSKIRKLLVNPKMKITYRKDNSDNLIKKVWGDMSYYAVYENSGYKVFKKSEISKHILSDGLLFGGSGIEWYLEETK